MINNLSNLYTDYCCPTYMLESGEEFDPKKNYWDTSVLNLFWVKRSFLLNSSQNTHYRYDYVDLNTGTITHLKNVACKIILIVFAPAFLLFAQKLNNPVLNKVRTVAVVITMFWMGLELLYRRRTLQKHSKWKKPNPFYLNNFYKPLSDKPIDSSKTATLFDNQTLLQKISFYTDPQFTSQKEEGNIPSLQTLTKNRIVNLLSDASLSHDQLNSKIVTQDALDDIATAQNSQATIEYSYQTMRGFKNHKKNYVVPAYQLEFLRKPTEQNLANLLIEIINQKLESQKGKYEQIPSSLGKHILRRRVRIDSTENNALQFLSKYYVTVKLVKTILKKLQQDRIIADYAIVSHSKLKSFVSPLKLTKFILIVQV